MVRSLSRTTSSRVSTPSACKCTGVAARRGSGLAFEELCEEVALLRRAVTGLAAERGANGIPDHSETLGQIIRASAATATGPKALAATPVLPLTAKDWVREIAAANEQARRSDHEAITSARDRYQRVMRDMVARLS